MATAVGQYATRTNVIAKMTQQGVTFGSADNSILDTICAQINGWIESKTGRILTPVAPVGTTVSSGATAGSTSVTLASGTGVSVGMALMFGPVSGTHEHAIVAAVAGAVVTLQSALVNTYANGTAVASVQVWDGDDALEEGRFLPVPNGIVAMTNLEVAFYTGGAFNLIPTTDWFLRPTPLNREPGWPATELWMTDIPSSNNPAPRFFRGLGTIRGSGITTGWPAVPDEITGLAERLAISVYRTRSSGGGGSVIVGSDGSRLIERELDARDWRLINAYQSREVQIV